VQHQKELSDGFKVHNTDILDHAEKKPQLKSILEQNSLEEFMHMASMSKNKFEAQKQNQVVIDENVVIAGESDGSNAIIDRFLSDQNVKNP